MSVIRKCMGQNEHTKRMQEYDAKAREDPLYQKAVKSFDESAYNAMLQGPPAVREFLGLFEGTAGMLDCRGGENIAQRMRAGAMIAVEDIFSGEPERVVAGSFRYLDFLDRTFESPEMVAAGRLTLQGLMVDALKDLAASEDETRAKQ